MEIQGEAISLQLCHKCQETVERAKRVFSSSTATKIPRSCDRVNRVLMFMGNFIERASVTKAGLDALIYFAKNGAIPSISAHDTLYTLLYSACC